MWGVVRVQSLGFRVYSLMRGYDWVLWAPLGRLVPASGVRLISLQGSTFLDNAPRFHPKFRPTGRVRVTKRRAANAGLGFRVSGCGV